MTGFALDHLTALDVSPPDLVDLAYAAGFTHVGLRVRPMDPSERRWPMQPGGRMLARTLARLEDTGLSVSQIEVLFLDEHTDLNEVERELEIGALLGASALYVVGMDADRTRLIDRFGDLESRCAAHGIRPLIEPMAYRPVSDLAQALEIVAPTETGGVLVDTLHAVRFGAGPADLAGLPAYRAPIAQVCDARADPAETPRDLVAARGQNADVGDLQWEARVGRLLPGEGVLALEELVSTLAASTLLALEAPNPASDRPLQEYLAAGCAALRRLSGEEQECVI